MGFEVCMEEGKKGEGVWACGECSFSEGQVDVLRIFQASLSRILGPRLFLVHQVISQFSRTSLAPKVLGHLKLGVLQNG